MNFKEIFIFVLISFFIGSCAAPKSVQENFWIKYSGHETGLDTLIKLNGYYSIAKPKTRKEYKGFKMEVTEFPDTFYMTYLFFRDGMYVRNFGFYEGHDPKAVKENFEKIHNDTTGEYSLPFSNSYYWGTYTLKGDTIITNYINNPCPPKVWIANQEYFKILNDSTILQVDYKSLEKMSESDRLNYEQRRASATYEPAIFIETPILPSSNSWLKKEKWFWKTDSLYYEFLRSNGS